ncbi:LbetaH domain-containing protein [Roseovarius salinarum]|uniref:chloramphenicol acetyltransferase n=1 Tax=Roseovarius salinarum TaxID=1981892 RepID=UPI000C33E487|nr:chloramphenicol acetyltransferase [Roseovarius salinarum]
MPRLSETDPFIHPDCEIADSDFGRFCEVGRGSRVAHSVFGDYSYCDRYCDIANAEIGKFSNIASFVRLGATDHPLDRASLHHFMYRSASYWDDAADDAEWFDARRARRCRIGHDTWLGHNAQIKPEVTIGHGAVVAAGAVVTRDVAPYTIVAGVPAKPVRARLPAGVADRLMALRWWDWDHDRLRGALDDFRSLSAEAFLDKHGG